MVHRVHIPNKALLFVGYKKHTIRSTLLNRLIITALLAAVTLNTIFPNGTNGVT
jgi:hypothetical protein